MCPCVPGTEWFSSTFYQWREGAEDPLQQRGKSTAWKWKIKIPKVRQLGITRPNEQCAFKIRDQYLGFNKMVREGWEAARLTTLPINRAEIQLTETSTWTEHFRGSRRGQVGALLTGSCPQHTRACACYVWGLLSSALGSAGLSTSGTFIAFTSGCQFLSDKLEPIQRRVTRTKKGLKIMSSQGVLKEPGLFGLGERRLSGGFESCFQITSCERRNRLALCISKVGEKI